MCAMCDEEAKASAAHEAALAKAATETRTVCSAYKPDTQKCRNGFPTNGGCWGMGFKAAGYQVPVCMNERAIAHYFPETGKPPDHMLDL